MKRTVPVDNDGAYTEKTAEVTGDGPAGAAATARRFGPLTLLALTAALIGLCIVLTLPFLPALTWGIALAIIALPFHQWVSRHTSSPWLAAGLASAAVVLVILVPLVFVVYELGREASAMAEQIPTDSPESVLRDKLAATPVLGTMVEWTDKVGLDFEKQARQLVEPYTRDVSNLAEGSVAASIQFLAAIFILYYFFRDRGLILASVRELLPLSRVECDRVFQRAADSVHANLYATLVTSTIDATGGTLMFWALGLPAPMLWGVVMFVLSILPIVGAALVWVPAAFYLAFTDRWLAGAALIGWGVLFFLIVDNVVYVRLAGNRMRMHPVPALIAFLGGLAVFGISGMIIGPAILAITVAFVEVWKKRVTGSLLPPELGDTVKAAEAHAAS
jgi:predicted PurR-regulated permease PerM